MDNQPNSQLPLPPTTTIAEDATIAGQRRINLIWEITQAVISIGITGAIIYSSLTAHTVQEIISNAFFLIVGFYFSRTNHAAIGGIGNKPIQNYEGR